MMTDIYISKNEIYYTNTRKDILSMMPKKSDQKVLEIGAGGGDTLVAIKKSGYAQEVWGIELFKLDGTNQSHEAIDQMFIADIEKDELNIPNNYFDVIICGDVLEHLVDPWAAMEKINKWTKTGGVFIASIPNIRELSAFYHIVLGGSFAYNPEGGIFDKTHLRFFCKKNMRDLFEQKGFDVTEMIPSFMFTGTFEKGVNLRRVSNMLTLGLFNQFLALQYITVGVKR
ncbi:ubiquinone/menaquinone biosynthesis C-methylase UbiE [Dyadobacter jejuensis]|uniref:Ubiquinone/menaquinone biosynthesis C-methylase UbiE n=1 Tax=Dyadobacter jejuensis TaxID=1082580 RepID=A0A316ASV6_9BACT|nr:class I SAM-dependent methyltransferase [Dyadobacter jejuensis]PWJ60399.1 ubiquinone/menaquinone biosynthesis C-methylase UbiE [Dyadobacter jejuensis]